MSETAKIRLVRCPKCEKLLPEVNDFSVYQCGGCGAVLRAKKKGVDLDTFSEKSDEERIGDSVEKFSDRYEKRMNVSERKMMDMSDGSESDVRSTISSSSRAERRRLLRDRAENNRTSFIPSNKEEKWDVGSDPIQDKQSDELHRARIAQDFDNMAIYHDNENVSRRLVDGRYEEEGFWRAQRMGPEVERHSKEMPLSRSNVGDDRDELLRKLDELTDQLSRRSGDLVDKGKEKIPLDMRMPPPHQDHPYAYDNWYPERNRANPHFKRPVYQYVEPPPPPLMHRQEMFYPPRYAPSHVQGYRRGHAYTSGPYMDDGMVYMDTMEQHYPPPPHFSRHHPSCSCYQCRAKRQVSPPIMPTAYSNKYSNVPIDMVPNYNHHIVSNPPPLRSQTHARWPSDVNSDVDGFILRRPARVHLPSGGKNCHPIAGGAPFLTCHNCFELLLLPKKVVAKTNSRKKLRCGGCSTVIAFAVSDKSLVVSFDVESKDSPNSPVKLDKSRLDQVRTAFSSGEYDNNSGFGFHSMDRSETGQVLPRVTSTYTSEGEEDMGSLTSARKDSGSADMSTEYKVPPPLAGEPDKVLLPNKSGNRLMRKESTATEIDLSSNEYSNTGTTFDSSEASREGDHLKASRGAESFFAGLMKKSFKDSHRSKEPENAANVTVNGHLISDRSLKKAEKVAGPIQPGHYWYDFRAGFWGAVGGPCLGMIPPFIEEFNYPMPEQCAGGNTHVYVNGRELNQKDLNLLVSRGLPIERDRSYIVEITGRVLDEDTGQELESLGKLAPTVERMKRGFGMRAPKAVA